MTTLVSKTCGQCGIAFSMPKEFEDECRKLGDSKTFYCPNGHPRVYRESAADVVRKEMRGIQQKLNGKDDALTEARAANVRAWAAYAAVKRSASAYKGHVTRLKNQQGQAK